MCGIFGGSAKKGYQLNILKLKMLGMYNKSRGKDSCGYYYSGNIVKGIDETGVNGKKYADFSEFIAYNQIERGDLDAEVFIGHTRHATVGSHTEVNAHPFEVNDYVQVHNGTIKNIDELIEKYNANNVFTVDSKGLAILIEQEGWKVLEEYLGWAALAMTWKTQPNKLYLYHGASKNIPKGSNWIERPLFYLIQEEGIYFSSLEESLFAIRDDVNDIPVDLLCNRVYTIEEGILDENPVDIDRWDKNIDLDKVKQTAVKPEQRLLPPSAAFTDDNVDDIIRKDEFIDEEELKTDKVLVKYGRYYWRGKLLTGAYVIDRDGFLVGENKSLDNLKNTYFFIRGIMMLSKYNYTEALREKIDKYKNTALVMSAYSKYPVFSLRDEAQHFSARYKNKWYEEERVVVNKRIVIPIFSRKEYVIESGKTTLISLL